MAIQQRKTNLSQPVQEYSKIDPGMSAGVNELGMPVRVLSSMGTVDHALGTVTLVRGKPLQVIPMVDAGIVQNTMDGRSQLLYASEHGNLDGAWLSVPGMSCIEFDKPIYLMQENYDEFRFPLASK